MHMHKLPHPCIPYLKGGIRNYCHVTVNKGIYGTYKSVTMCKTPFSNNTHYANADPLTRAVICDHLDEFGLLFQSGVEQPQGYQRKLKCVKRDTPVPRTSDRLPGHKQEQGTCPVKECQDRTGMCECMCHTCFGFAKECGCCKTCFNKEGECVCHP